MIGRWLRFLLSLLLPQRGWKRRVVEFRKGRIQWEVPGRPDAPRVVPFPVEWIAAIVLPIGEGHTRGWEPVSAPCSDCGKPFEAPHGVRCVRCGVMLHETCAGMVAGDDLPACVACTPRVKYIARSA